MRYFYTGEGNYDHMRKLQKIRITAGAEAMIHCPTNVLLSSRHNYRCFPLGVCDTNLHTVEVFALFQFCTKKVC